MSNFMLDLKRGSIGEQKVIELLRKNGYEVEDLTDFQTNKATQLAGYDIRLKVEEQWLKADIKCNVKNGFTYLEMEQDTSRNPGWFQTSEADIILCYDRFGSKLYQYDLNKMREYVNERKDTLKLCGRYKNLYGFPVAKNVHIKQIL